MRSLNLNLPLPAKIFLILHFNECSIRIVMPHLPTVPGLVEALKDTCLSCLEDRSIGNQTSKRLSVHLLQKLSFFGPVECLKGSHLVGPIIQRSRLRSWS